jgi:voltage-gated potassium channel
VTVGLGVVMFTNTEGMSAKDAAYYSVITGTTIGYGDLSPTSDNGKIAAAIYALIAVNVVGALLDGPKEFLTNLVSDDLVSFEEVDKDHDGKIDREEFAALKKELAALKKAQ